MQQGFLRLPITLCCQTNDNAILDSFSRLWNRSI